MIGWSQHNVWYYGVRYGKNCSPDDFWIKYFTSSKRVKQFKEKNGDPDIIQVRKIFKNKYSAIKWETIVIKRLNIVENIKWLNISNNSPSFMNIGGYCLPNRTKDHCEKISKAKKGKSVFSEQEKKRRSKEYSGEGNPNFGKKYSREQKIKILKGQNKFRPFNINGKQYELISDASDELKISTTKIKGRLNSCLLKWENWRYFDDKRIYRQHATNGKLRPDLSEMNKKRKK